jgi:hypothetical protein
MDIFVKIVFFIIISLYLIIFIKNLFNLKEYIKDFKFYSKEKAEKKLVFFIPVYLEQKIIEDTYNYFSKILKENSNTELVFVTTSKEKDAVDSTLNILRKINSDGNTNIHIYEYKGSGVMAHQVNFGVSEYRKNFGADFNLVIYNADSRPSQNSINEIIFNLNRNDCKSCVFQQYGYYLVDSNFGIPASGSIWQTRWSVLYEYAMAKNKSKGKYSKKNMAFFEKFVYVIGHGLVSSYDLYVKIGGMPENVINEDTFMGYLFNNRNVKILPLTTLEKAEGVGTTKELFKQQTSWYNGPIYSFHYYSLYKKMLLENNEKFLFKDKLRALVLAYKSFLLAIYWLFSPIILLFILPLISYFAYNFIGLLIWFVVYALYLPVTNHLLRYKLSTKCNIKELKYPSIIFDALFYLLHSIAAFNCIYKILFRKNKIEKKYKTKR